jgi:hypothetical protein
MVQEGGTLSLGTGGAGWLFNSGGLMLGTNATWVVDLVGTEAGTGYDQVVVAAGQFAFGHAELRIGLDPTNAVYGTEYAIGHITGGGGTSVERFWFGGAAVEEGMTNSFGSAYEYVITYKAILDGDGYENDIVLRLIPEPSALTLVGAGLLVLLVTRRRRWPARR